jgi:taurine dioxygenase
MIPTWTGGRDMSASVSTATGSLAFRPVGPGFAAEIIGFDIAAPITPDAAETLRAAYRQYQVLVLRGQPVSPDQQQRFGEVFGTTEIREYNKVQPKDGYSSHVSNVLPDGVFGQGELRLHMDQLFFPEPLAALMLYAIDIPAEGGDTLFCDTSQVLAAMPAALRDRIATLTARTGRHYDAETAQRYNVSIAPETIVHNDHKLVWQEPETGRRSLWIGRRELTRSIAGMADDAAQALLDEVRDCINASTAIYRHKWRPDDLVLWNNRTLQHAREPFDNSQPRTLRRTALMARAA